MKQRSANSFTGMMAVLFIAVLCQSSGAESPALAYIAQAFPETPQTTIIMITTIPVLMVAISSLIFSAIRKVVKIRTLVLISMIIAIIGGVSPAFAQSVTQILIGRAVFGLGMGIMWPLGQALIVELYDGNKQDKMLGYNNVVVAGGGIIWANVGGLLALYGWRYSFYTYFIPIIILVIVMMFLPEPPKPEVKAVAAAEENKETAKKVSIGALIILLIAYFVYGFANMTYFTNISLKIVGEGIGTSATAGVAQSMFTVGSFISGLLFGYIMKIRILKKLSLGVGWLFNAVGFLIVAGASSFGMIVVGSLLGGIGTAWFVPAIIGMFGKLGGSANAASMIGISAAVFALAQFLGPQVLNAIISIVDATAPAGSFPIELAGYIHLAGAVISIVVCFILGNSKKENIINAA